MKNKLLLSLVAISLMALPNSSFALSTTSDDSKMRKEVRIEEMERNRENIKNEIEEKREALKQRVEQKREEIKNSVEERKQNAADKIIERVNQFAINIINRYEAAVNRLEILADRIEFRMAKIEERSIDVSEAKDLMAVAKTKIEIARASVLDIASTTNDTTFGTTTVAVREDYEVIKTQMRKAKDDIKAAHAALIDVVNSLKPGNNKLKELLQTTSTTTDDN